MRKKVYSIWLLVSALVIGAWFGPNRAAAARPAMDATSACDHATTFLVGGTAELPRAKDLIHDMCDFRVRVDEIPSNASEIDRMFVEDAITSNALELQSLQIALDNATNEEWRGVVQMMITMHTSDQEMLLRVAKKIGAATTPNLTNARVFPETPDYDLGIRRVNLEEKFLNPLIANAPGPSNGTPTGVPTDMTGTVTAVPTDLGTITAVPTDTGTALPTDTATGLPIDTVTALPTDTSIVPATDTSTALPTDTATGLPTDTGTALPTDTGTALPTDTGTVFPTDTGTALPTDTGAAPSTDTATAVATDTPTMVPTTVPTTPPSSFDLLAMHVIQDEHMMDVETTLVAQRLLNNGELRAFAKHASDVTHLHMMLIDNLQHRFAFNLTPPPPRYQQDYQSPRRFEPR